MADMIKGLVQLAVFIVMISIIGYFVAFNLDPYNVCIDHPNPKHKDKYFQCKFGPITKVLKKPEPERKFREGKEFN